MVTRRRLLHAGGILAASGLLPAWARSAGAGNRGIFELAGPEFNLTIDHAAVAIDGRAAHAISVNGTVPGPLLRFRQGEKVTLGVRNLLDEDSSIHWHGLLVPFQMDGVPGVAFPGIRSGETFVYEYSVPQYGTYWYHSHSGLQEQSGHFGPLIIDPAGRDPVEYDREYVLMLSDWVFAHPHRLFTRLKQQSDVFNFQQRTVGDFMNDAAANGLGATIADRAMWGRMRMSPTDIADVTGAAYTYIINGHSTADNWTCLFEPGERVRLRVINSSAMTIFNFRIPGLPMTVVQSDGLNVEPLATDEFQIGVAETYDVIVEPKKARPYAIVAESIDRSGQAVATLAPEAGMIATAPLLRDPPLLTHKDMGMAMDHGAMSGMDHGAMQGMDHSMNDSDAQAHAHKVGFGVDNLAEAPVNRLDEPGLGLEDVPHRALRYSQLRSLEPNPDTRAPDREFEIHLTGNMERFMWSFDGVKFSDAKGPLLTVNEGERVRLAMVNDTMMTHPIHLHGQFFEVVNGASDRKPRKHTINVKPGEKLPVEFTANPGDWAFHCHLLLHMHAGMMQVVSVRPRDALAASERKPKRDELGRLLEPAPKSQPDAHEEMGHGGHEPAARRPKSAPKEQPAESDHTDHESH